MKMKCVGVIWTDDPICLEDLKNMSKLHDSFCSNILLFLKNVLGVG